MEHLDAEAVRMARESYKEKLNSEHIGAEVDRMTDEEFLMCFVKKFLVLSNVS
jgi:hypothetical protein